MYLAGFFVIAGLWVNVLANPLVSLNAEHISALTVSSRGEQYQEKQNSAIGCLYRRAYLSP